MFGVQVASSAETEQRTVSGGEEEWKEQGNNDSKMTLEPPSVDKRGNNVPSDDNFAKEAAAYNKFVANLEQDQPYNAYQETSHKTMAQDEDT